MPLRPFKFAVTFEYDTQAPETVRGELELPNASLAARRALEAARKALPNRRWRSCSILLEQETEAGTYPADGAL